MQLVSLACAAHLVLVSHVSSFVLPRAGRAGPHLALRRSAVTSATPGASAESFTFQDLGPRVASNLAAEDIVEPRPFQVEGFRAICDDGASNVLLSAETGSGKTLAYTLPLLRLMTSQDSLVSNPRTVVMLPNALLVHQVHRVLSSVTSGTGLRCTMVDDIETQEMPDIVVGTPLKLLGKFKVYNLNFKVDVFKNVAFLVLDEADQLVEQTREESLREFLKLASNRRKTVLAAATVSTAGRRSTENTMDRLFRNLRVVRSAGVHAVPEHIAAEFVYCTDRAQKVETLLQVLQQVRPRQRALIFCGSVESSHLLTLALKAASPGMDVGLVNRSVDTEGQLAVLDPVRGSKFVVCTDALARGLDIGEISLVVQFDFPTNVLGYIHRAGRTGRGPQGGKTVLLWTDDDREFYHLLQEHRSDLTALFSRKRGLRKKLKRGVAVGAAGTPLEAGEAPATNGGP